MERTIIAGVLVSLAAACAHAPYQCPERGGPAWIEARSAHFVAETNLPAADISTKLVELERLRAGLALLWKAPPEPHAPVYLFLPRNGREAAEFTERGTRFRYTPFLEDLVIASGQTELADDPIVKTAVVGTLDGLWRIDRLAWVGFGFEAYLGGARIDGNEVVIGEPSLIALRRIKDHHGIVPVSWIVDEKSPAYDRGTSFVLVHYLIDAYRAEFGDLLRRLGTGETEHDAVANAFGNLKLASLDDAVEEYWKKGVLRTIRLPLPIADEQVETRPLSEAELHGWRAEALRHGDHSSWRDVERELEEAQAHDPTEPRALAGSTDRNERLERARIAVRAHPRDWRAWYLLWLWTADLGHDDYDDLIRDHKYSRPPNESEDEALARAAEFTEANAIPHLLLADVLLARKQFAQALPEAQQAARLAPLNPAALDTYAAALVAAERWPEACAARARAAERANRDFSDQLPDDLKALPEHCPKR